MGRLPLAGNAFYALCCCYYIIFVCTYKNFFSPRSYRRVLCFSSVLCSCVHQHTHETTSQDFVLGDSLSLFLRRRRRENVFHLGSLSTLANDRPIHSGLASTFFHLHREHVRREYFALVRHAEVHQSSIGCTRGGKTTSEKRVRRARRLGRQQTTTGRFIKRSLAKRRSEFRETREEVERRVRWEDHGG